MSRNYISRRIGRFTILTVVIALLTVATNAVPGTQALDLYKITGTVIDAIGRPLAGVDVSDGLQHATTTTTGHYELGESSTGNFTIIASRSGLVTTPKSVAVTLPVDTVADITMLYDATAVFTPAAVTTATSAVASTLEITAFAPNPGTPGSTDASCVFVTDDQSGATTAATFDHANADGSSQWVSVKALGQFTVNGAQTVTHWAEDCSSHTPLTDVKSAALLVDNVAPNDSGRIWPLNGTHAAFSTVPITAQIGDLGGSGIDPTSLSVTVVDSLGSTVASFTHSQITFVPTTGVLRTPNLNLTAGSTYRTSISGSDKAGNLFTFLQDPISSGGGFTVNSVSIGAAGASIPATDCALTSSGGLSTTKTATCTNVPVVFTPSTSTFTTTRYAGRAMATHIAPLTTAHFQTTVLGVTATSNGDPSWSPVEDDMWFDVSGPSSTPQTVNVPGGTITLETLTGQVPAAWTSAQVVMSPITTNTSPTGRACADPTIKLDTCLPDVLFRPVTSYTTITGDEPYSFQLDEATGLVSVNAPPRTATTRSIDGTVLGIESVPTIFGDSVGGSAGSQPFVLASCSRSRTPDKVDTYKYATHDAEVAYAQWSYWLRGWSYYRYDTTYGWMNAWSNCAGGGTDPKSGWRADYSGVGVSIATSTPRRTTSSYAVGDSMSSTPSSVSFSINVGAVKVSASNQQNANGHNRGANSADWPGDDDRVLKYYQNNTTTGWWKTECGWFCGYDTDGSTGYQGTTLESVWQLPLSSTPNWQANDTAIYHRGPGW